MEDIVKMLIKESKPKMFRGKPTNRRMFNFGKEYYDKNIPSKEEIPNEVKQYFNIPNYYDNCFINVYKNDDLIGLHKDKIGNMNVNKKIISVSIGINKDGLIINDENIKLGWMEINKKKIDIYNKKKIELSYEDPHRAKTKLKDNILYRLNFTFRVSINYKEDEKKILKVGDSFECFEEGDIDYESPLMEKKSDKIKKWKIIKRTNKFVVIEVNIIEIEKNNKTYNKTHRQKIRIDKKGNEFIKDEWGGWYW
mgnify:CR=1 FL=1|tara:strand:- start:732 stop:1487 length:756 start_codon:yes stop_codon:yes gene_type:complete